MLDVASGRVLRDARVVVTGELITAVNPATSPAGARVIDLGDVTLMPGFIDLHTHLGGEIGANSFIEPVLETNVDAAFKATRHARTTVMAGFTTVRDFGGDVTVALARAVDGGTLALHAGADVASTTAALCALPGIGDWTAQYIAMRVLRWPDAFPAGDVALHKALGVQGHKNPARAASEASQSWRPWRSYAVLRAWAAGTPAGAVPPAPSLSK